MLPFEIAELARQKFAALEQHQLHQFVLLDFVTHQTQHTLSDEVSVLFVKTTVSLRIPFVLFEQKLYDPRRESSLHFEEQVGILQNFTTQIQRNVLAVDHAFEEPGPVWKDLRVDPFLNQHFSRVERNISAAVFWRQRRKHVERFS